MGMGELAGAVLVPKYPVTLAPFGCPASQISVVAGTTMEPACAAKLHSAIASGTSVAARNVWKSEGLFGLGAASIVALVFMVGLFIRMRHLSCAGEPPPLTANGTAFPAQSDKTIPI
jgi:hypothetical protein